MPLEGKGIFIWKIHRCEKGNPAAIASRACDAGLSHVLIKIADGPRAYNVDLAAPLVEALKGAGIQAWGWQFVYGNEPFGEADIAVHRIKALGLDGFVVNAEMDYKGKHAAASAYMESLKARVAGIPVALSSFRYPSYHPELPWTEFLSGCEYNMPQVYWVQANNPAHQLDRCIQQFRDIYPVLPIIPTGAAYEEYGWRPKPSELQQLLQHVRELGLPAVNFWSWDYAGSAEGRDLWNVVADYDWPVKHSRLDIIDTLANALNGGDTEAILSLYQPNAVLVTPRYMLQGHEALQAYYIDLLTKELPGATFVVETRVNEGYIRHIKWDALSATNGNSVHDGQDTIALRQGLIQYHSSVYQIV
jgi:hypothetical protein